MNVKKFDIGRANYSRGIGHHHRFQHDNEPGRRRMLARAERHRTRWQPLVLSRRSLDWSTLLVSRRSRSECALRIRAHIAADAQTRRAAFAQFAIGHTAGGK